MRADLHVHTTASDGILDPASLVARAVDRGVELLSITDHDTLGAYDNLVVPDGIEVVHGIEISARWERMSVHIVGLDVDGQSRAMSQALAELGAARTQRALQIAERLEPLGIKAPLEAATRLANGGAIGRPHFAAALVEAGVVRTIGEAFKKHLGNGKRGDVGHLWPELDQVVAWINGAGGVAVLAHPLHYGLTMTRLKRLVSAFMGCGGTAIEVLSGRQAPDATWRVAELAKRLGLLASCGSDFHRPMPHGADIGGTGPLPVGLQPVWEAFRPWERK